ncbi:hypothetical protein ADUPG1_005472, partial [Aduncisulcus paluster]
KMALSIIILWVYGGIGKVICLENNIAYSISSDMLTLIVFYLGVFNHFRNTAFLSQGTNLIYIMMLCFNLGLSILVTLQSVVAAFILGDDISDSASRLPLYLSSPYIDSQRICGALI